MKRTATVLALLLVSVPSAALAKGHARPPSRESLEQERAAAAAAAVEAERARVAAEAVAEAAKAEADANAKKEAEYVSVRVDSNYSYTRFEPDSADQKTVFCGSPCVVRLHAGTSYRALAPGMLGSKPVVVNEKTRSIVIRGSSRARHDGGLAATAIGMLGLGTAAILLEECAKEDDYSLSTQKDLLVAGAITTGIGIAIGITGLVLMNGSTKTETASSPAAASARASKPRLLRNGTFVF